MRWSSQSHGNSWRARRARRAQAQSQETAKQREARLVRWKEQDRARTARAQSQETAEQQEAGLALRRTEPGEHDRVKKLDGCQQISLQGALPPLMLDKLLCSGMLLPIGSAEHLVRDVIAENLEAHLQWDAAAEHLVF